MRNMMRAPSATDDLLQNGASRRSLLRAFTTIPMVVAATLPSAAAGALRLDFDGKSEQPITLQRTRDKRRLSRIRYQRADSFFAPIEQGLPFRGSDQLYHVGIVLQLALSAHLLDVGFDDAWCARNIGLYLNRSLEHANATGLGHDSPELKEVAEFLSPYGRWRNPDGSAAAGTCPFSHEQICYLARELLERVREVTGHPRPRGRSQRNG